MTWSDLKEKNINEVVDCINNKLSEFESLKKVGDELGANESTIRKWLNKKGYKRTGNKFVEDNKSYDDKYHIDSISSKIDDDIKYLSSEIDNIKNVLEWFKTKDDSYHICVIKENDISIDLPDQSIKRTTVRINNTVWEMFNKFADENKHYDKHDLLSQLLLESLLKYVKSR
ncbi:TPA: hypothetical protein P1J70_002653 [Clostridioides difficile]|uniref:hypothetical protein n=3 Tax=Clostridioides difficile TaxID=1496 RepID=UPI00038D5420|nr:hypothetical protein [Clostridioides difficile]EAA0001164.1 hypothetical protein [Clostridioides difficile]EGT3728784.1 hypothetical protein [Clostridioides difficile]EGT3734456.1 hypothetical protein [Clostridioides difficile]EGT3772562.1 hypothetical protein [Clostridioides difficile]EGT3805819.1 hypothetical protein [Clostridioides difficile]